MSILKKDDSAYLSASARKKYATNGSGPQTSTSVRERGDFESGDVDPSFQNAYHGAFMRDETRDSMSGLLILCGVALGPGPFWSTNRWREKEDGCEVLSDWRGVRISGGGSWDGVGDEWRSVKRGL